MIDPEFVVHALDADILAKEEPRLPDGRYHPSSLWFCNRQAIYGVRGTEPTNPPDLRTKRLFKIGHVLHDVIQTAIEDSGEVNFSLREFAVEIDDLNISGHGDMLVEIDKDNWVVVEIKSIAANGFRFVPKEDHIKQASIYAIAARDYGISWAPEPSLIPPLGDRLKGIVLVYFEKEKLLTKQFFFPYTDEWRTQLEEKVAELEPYRLDPDSLPRRLPMKDGKLPNWPCGYCPFRERCVADPLEISTTQKEDW